MKNYSIKTFLLLSFTFCSITQAESEKRDHDKKGHKDRPNPIERFDTDGDQMLSFTEFSQSEKLQSLTPGKVEKLFDHLDKNDDGQLNDAELPRGKGPRGGNHKHGREHFKTLDKNGDRKLSKEEFLAGKTYDSPEALERHSKLFTTLDKNGDGFLSRDDRPSSHHRAHPNRGVEGRKPLENMIERVDANKDGAVSLEEFLTGKRVQELSQEKAQEMFERIDLNNDGVITLEDRLEHRHNKGE